MEERDFFNFKDLIKTIRMYKKYSKYYKKEFIPITTYEKSNRDKTFQRFEAFKMLLFTFSFFFSSKIRNAYLSLRNRPEDTFAASLIFRISWGMVLYLIAHLIGLKLIFTNCLHIRLRMAHESNIKFDRSSVKELFDEYPFSHKEDFLYSDLEIRNRLTKFDLPRNQKFKKEFKSQEEIDEYKRKRNSKFIIEREKD